MSTSALLAKLKRLGIRVWAEDGRLGFDAPAGRMTQDLRDELRAHKTEILAYLTEPRDRSQPTAAPLLPVPRDGELPLSFAQQRLWFMDQLVPNSPFYNIPAALRFQGDLHREALHRCLDELVARHETLRTVFPDRQGEPVQRIIPPAPTQLPEIDLTRLPVSEREAEMERLAAEEGRRPFPLRCGPLFRTCLIRLDDQDHVLLLNMHHIVSDGFSYGVLLREMSALYEAFRKGEPSRLPPLAIQYADFAVWQRQWLQGELLRSLLHHWSHRLRDAATLQLPTDHQRPAAQSFRGAREVFALPQVLSKAVESLSRSEGTTLFMTLLAAFKALLHRYSGQDDIVVGSPIANRSRPEIEGLIGFFVNSLVLRTDVSGNPTFRELLRRVRDVALDAYDHQDLPFERLVDELQPQRDLSQNPLFQVTFALQNAPLRPLALTNLSVSWVAVPAQTTRSDLEIHVWRTKHHLQLSIIYNTDLFDRATISRMGRHYQMLLEAVAADPEQRLSDLKLMPEEERRQVLQGWNQTAAAFPPRAVVHHRFEQQVDKTPEAVAVRFEDRRLTYGQLNASANRLAHQLIRRGVGPDDRVGLYAERSLEMVVGMLGILKAGGAYVPLDPDCPSQRLAFLVRDIQPPLLLTHESLKPRLSDIDVPVMSLDACASGTAAGDPSNPVRGVTAEHAAYIMYTSGSTGMPKGVVISHHALCNHMFWMQDTFPVTEGDRILQKTPFTFDASVWEFFAPLLAGAQLVMARPEGHRDPEYLVRAIDEYQVTVLQLVPSLLRMLMAHPGFEQCRSLVRVFCGGETLSRDLAGQFLDRMDASLHNLYGPTEATIDATYWTCQRGDNGAAIPIGRPISNTRAYILDRYLNPVPVGVLGEIYLGGAGLARGYLNRSELTRRMFVPDPFGDQPGSRLYRTGDLGRWRPDGAIEFLGRRDQQVKVRGFRVELGEIEAVLAEHAATREVVVVVRKTKAGDGQLVAYLACDADKRPDVADLHAQLRNVLPDYMVPSAIEFLDALPLTPHGKVDREALPPPQTWSESRRDVVPPRTPVEAKIAEIFGAVLPTPCVGVHDNFFDLGGHSLLAAQVVARLRSTFQLDVSVRNLFEAPTVARMAELLEQLFASAIEPLTDEEAEQLNPAPHHEP